MCDFRGVLYTPLGCPGSPEDIKLHFFMQSLPVLTSHYNSQYIVCFQNSFLYKISCPTFQSGCLVAHSHTVPRSTVQPYGSPRSHGSTDNRPAVQPYGCPRSHGSTVNRPTVQPVPRSTVQPSNRTVAHGHTVPRSTVQPYGRPRSHGSTVNSPTVRSPTVTRFHGQPSNRPTVRSPTVTRFHGHTVNRETVADRDLTVWPCNRGQPWPCHGCAVTRSRSKLAQRRASGMLRLCLKSSIPSSS